MKQKKIMKGLKEIANRPGEVEMPESCLGVGYDQMEKDSVVAAAAIERIKKLEKKVKKLEGRLEERSGEEIAEQEEEDMER